jgi:hypothetical protein
VTNGVDYWRGLYDFFGAALVAIGLSVNMWGYAIAGVVLAVAGIFLLWAFRRLGVLQLDARPEWRVGR